MVEASLSVERDIGLLHQSCHPVLLFRLAENHLGERDYFALDIESDCCFQAKNVHSLSIFPFCFKMLVKTA